VAAPERYCALALTIRAQAFGRRLASADLPRRMLAALRIGGGRK